MKPRHVRVALVDDDISVRKALKRLLLAFDIEVETFASAGEFLCALDSNVPDCLLLDLQMPEMTGLELQRRLAKDGRRLPTVIVTAHDEPAARSRCLAAGADAYLTKPLVAETLVAAIRNAVES